MIQARNLSLSFGNQTIFDNISFIVNQEDRIGLVGRNGSGKTTLLRAILEPTVLDSGSISIQNKKRIAYMPQEVVLLSNLSILDETFTTFHELYQLQQEAALLETQINTATTPELIERYAAVQEQLTALSPEILRAKTKKILMGLGFSLEQLDQPVSTLSVGWKMRIVLAKLLLQDADFYLFDEPTNHLDLIAKEWFLDFLKHAPFGFFLICHERYFLDELCEKIVDIERGKATWYTGNYSNYVVQKEHAMQLLETAYIQQQKDIKRKEATIERFRASASRAKMAQSMEKALDKIERIEMPPSPKNVNFGFPPVQQSGKLVIKVDHVSQKFGDKTIFQNVSFEIERNQKVALIAPNGAGKTTLFNLITGALPLQQGTITFGYNVTHAIFAQDQNKALNMKLSILENVREQCPKATEQKIRTFLGSFLFSNDDVQKAVGVLSGGEKNRVGMVNVLLQNTNLLLLDEPTNHLDIPSKEVLLKALQEFKGTLVFVSHDRDFINQLATDIIELTPQGAYLYHGNYDAYTYHKTHANKDQVAQPKNTYPKPKEARTKEKNPDTEKQIKTLENKIILLEKEIQKIYTIFGNTEYGTQEFEAAQKKLQKLQQQLRDAEVTWEQLYSLSIS